MVITTPLLLKNFVFGCFQSAVKRKAGVFNLGPVKGAFLGRISVDCRPSRRNKAAFLNPSVLLCCCHEAL